MSGRGPYSRSDRELLARIRRSPNGRAGYKQLIRELGLDGGQERRLLWEQLTRMVGRSELVRLDGDAWALPAAVKPDRRPNVSPQGGQNTPRSGRDRLVSGRLDLHRDGFGFVRPQQEGEDIFIPPNEIAGAMQGDLVLVDEAPPGRDGRRSGRVVRVLTRRNPTVVGIFHYARSQGRRRSGREMRDFALNEPRGNFIKPFDERVAGWVEIPEGAEVVAAAAESEHRMLGDEARAQRAKWDPANSKDPRWPLEGMAVDVELTQFPSAGRPARGRIIEVLGPPDAFGVDVEIVIRKHHLPHTFPARVIAEAHEQAQETVASLSTDELALREDFRGLPIVTIDGETARDFDDAVLVRPLPNGNTELQVHIADVSWYVQSGTALDTEARVRGTSVYFPDRAVPMLPHALSSGMCSLLPNEDRLVQSCIMEIDSHGEITGYRLCEGIIRSMRRCTYTSVQHCLNASPQRLQDGDQGSAVTSEPTAEDFAERERVAADQPEMPAAFDAMLELALRLNAKRQRRGSIDFDLPEPVVEFDPDGNMAAIVRSERGWAHRLIEEFMLSANECVAAWLRDQGIPSIYRIHEMPDPKRIMEFEETAAAFRQTLGIGALPVKRMTMKADRRSSMRSAARGRGSRDVRQHEIPAEIPVTPQMYQRLVRRISGHPEERILAYLMLRSLKQARYAEQNEGHFALASPCYTHFTSPIRRYPDLIVHRLLRAMLRDGAGPRGGPIRSDDPQPWASHAADGHRRGSSNVPGRAGDESGPIAATELSDIAVESSQAERRAADAERELMDWKKMRFMADKIGDDFKAIILSVTKYGFFVELDELFIEGLVPIGSLTGDHYSFRDTDRTICGARTGHCFRVGERVEVILDRIDRQQMRLQFALLPGTEPVVTSGARKTPQHAKSKKTRSRRR
ncbi:MAG TPA: RNB domain-containing ribonuclease [Candidatus Aquilonibacter sp.]|nr:RNB domain-containing ribonuclease [Candidatus Aquilonibacter sp.]